MYIDMVLLFENKSRKWKLLNMPNMSVLSVAKPMLRDTQWVFGIASPAIKPLQEVPTPYRMLTPLIISIK